MFLVLALIIAVTIGSVAAGYVNPSLLLTGVPMTCSNAPFSWNQADKLISPCPPYGIFGSIPIGYVSYNGPDGSKGYRWPEPLFVFGAGGESLVRGESMGFGVVTGLFVKHSPYRQIQPDGTSIVKDNPQFTPLYLFGSVNCDADYCSWLGYAAVNWASHALFSSHDIQLGSLKVQARYSLVIGEFDTAPGFSGTYNPIVSPKWEVDASCNADIDSNDNVKVAQVIHTGTKMFNFMTATTSTHSVSTTTGHSDYYYGVATWVADGLCGQKTFYKKDSKQPQYSTTSTLTPIVTCSDKPVTIKALDVVAYREGGVCTTRTIAPSIPAGTDAPNPSAISPILTPASPLILSPAPSQILHPANTADRPMDNLATITYQGVTYTVSSCSLQTSPQ